MAISQGQPSANAVSDPIARFGRWARRLLRAWQEQATEDRELWALNDRLLVDIGMDVHEVRARARIADLGRPSRAKAPCEVAQGGPAHFGKNSRS